MDILLPSQMDTTKYALDRVPRETRSRPLLTGLDSPHRRTTATTARHSPTTAADQVSLRPTSQHT